MSNCQLEAPIIDQSRAYIFMTVDFMSVGNTTDAVGGGYAPIKATVINGISTQY
jgi:hypothetical protein